MVLTISVKDSGDGFDFSADRTDSRDSYGRGLTLVQEVSENLTFLDNGTHVIVDMKLKT